MGRVYDVGALAMPLRARCLGGAILANADQKDDFLERELARMLAWLDAIAAAGPAQKMQ